MDVLRHVEGGHHRHDAGLCPRGADASVRKTRLALVAHLYVARWHCALARIPSNVLIRLLVCVIRVAKQTHCLINLVVGVLISQNAVNPGYCATDQNMNQGSLPPAVGAQTPAALACLGSEGEEGGEGGEGGGEEDGEGKRGGCSFQTGRFFSYTGEEIDWLQT